MLILSRKKDQEIIIGEGIIIRVCQIKGSTVRIGIKAAKDISIRRGELGDFGSEFVFDIRNPQPELQTSLDMAIAAT